MTDFIKLVREGREGGRTSTKGAVDSHVMCFAAEKSAKKARKSIWRNTKKSFGRKLDNKRQERPFFINRLDILRRA